MQAAPAPSSLPPNMNSEKMPSRETERTAGTEQTTTATTTTTTTTTSLPGIRDLFPDHLFEAQQRLEPLVDPRTRKDPFLPNVSTNSNAMSEREKEMHREAFVALTSPFPRPTRMEPRSPYASRPPFTFPGPPPLATKFAPTVPLPPQTSTSSSGPPGVPPTASISPQATRPESSKHRHTYSSDASAAAAGLLGLSLSGGPTPSTVPASLPQALDASRDRRHDGEWEDGEDNDNDDDSMFVFQMDDSRDGGRAQQRKVRDDEGTEMEMDGVETAPTSVDSHASIDVKPGGVEKLPKDKKSVSAADPSSLGEQDESGDRDADPASSAENEGGEGEGEGEGGDGKRHTCPHCRKRFNRPSSLKIHLNTHTGAKPFECPYPGCGRQFNVSSNMRRHYRNHSSPAGFGPGAAPSMGVGIGMGVHEPFAPRPPPGVLDLHVGPPKYPATQHAQRIPQMPEIDRGRMVVQSAHSREAYARYGPQHPHAAPSAYRAPLPPAPNGIHLAHAQASARLPGPPPPAAPYGTYPLGFGPRDVELDRRERMAQLERENWILRQREQERMGRLEARQPPPGYPPQPHQQAFHQDRGYAHYSPPSRERHLDYRVGGYLGHPGPAYSHHQQMQPHTVPPSVLPSQVPSQPQPPIPSHLPPGQTSVPALRPSHSFSHPHPSPHVHPYARSSHSQSASRSRERYSSRAGSPVRSPIMSAVASLPTRGWRGHTHTQSAPAFSAGSDVQLPPVSTMPFSPGRSPSFSTPNAQYSQLVPLRGSTHENERRGRRTSRDSISARTGHESEHEINLDSASDVEGGGNRTGSDVDMADVVREKGSVLLPPPRSAVTQMDVVGRHTVSVGYGEEDPPVSAQTLGSSAHTRSPSLHQQTPPARSVELRRRPSNTPAVPLSGSSSTRERAHSHYSHSRTGSGSSSGHGHGYASHPYARARHAHSRSREAAAVAIDIVSPRLGASLSMSPHPPPSSISASISPRAPASVSTFSSPRQTQSSVSELSVRPSRESRDAGTGSKLPSPVSRFPVYTFPPPPPPPGAVRSAGSPATMEVET